MGANALLLAGSLAVAGALGAPAATRRALPELPIANANTSLTHLYQNNLNLTDDAFHPSAVILDAVPPSKALEACKAALNESLVSRADLDAYTLDYTHMLVYHAGRYPEAGFNPNVPASQFTVAPRYAIAGGEYVAVSVPATWLAPGQPPSDEAAAQLADQTPIPPLCAQSNKNYKPDGDADPAYLIRIGTASGATYTGYRDQKSFRFLGIRYAQPPKRWEYAVPVEAPAAGVDIDATRYGSQCVQPNGDGSEDCLFLNIQTPYIPKAGSAAVNSANSSLLRPVHFFIHGGGFTGGSSNGFDGGQLVSREDVVHVTLNYRLSTLGFLAVPGTDIKGNYGIADQILALDWVRANIAAFGGDPDKITINGGSAGAASVRVLLGSPKAIGKFHGAIAMSNLGGGQSLGLEETYATAYSSYLTVEKAFEKFSGLFAEAGCAGDSKTTASAAQIDCLKKVDAAKLVAQPTVARYVVQDGAIVTTPELPLSGKPGAVANVPVIFGVTSDDGASFTTYPKTPVASLEEGIMVGLGISKEYAQMVLASGLFNLTNPTGNVTLDAFNITQRVSTDLQFRCVDQATVYAGALSKTFPAAYYYELTRTIGGYDPNNLGGPPGNDPNAPYFRLHGGDAPWILGILRDPRNSDDLYSVQASVDVFGAFIRTGDPNPTMQFMRYRGYEEVDDMLAQYAGPWQKVNGPDEKANVRLLDWPAASTGWVDEAQCKFLNYTITSFYVK